eukprot:ctg_1132.g361
MSSLRRSNEESVWRRALSQRDGRSPDGGSATVTDSRQARTVLGRLSQVRAAHQERALPANFESDESFSSEEASDDDVSTGEVTPSTSVPEGRVAKTESRPHSGTSVRASPPAPPTFTPSATHRAPTYASMVSPHASRSRRTPMERPGVRSVVRQRILERVIRETLASVRGLPLPPTAADASARTPSAEHGWLVLVLDQYAMRVVSAVMHMSDLLNEGVALVERHELPRERFPRMHAIFILQPCEQSVRILLDEDPTAYAGFHIYFLTPVPNKVMERFTQSATDARPPGTSKREQRERRERAAKAQALRGVQFGSAIRRAAPSLPSGAGAHDRGRGAAGAPTADGVQHAGREAGCAICGRLAAGAVDGVPAVQTTGSGPDGDGCGVRAGSQQSGRRARATRLRGQRRATAHRGAVAGRRGQRCGVSAHPVSAHGRSHPHADAGVSGVSGGEPGGAAAGAAGRRGQRAGGLEGSGSGHSGAAAVPRAAHPLLVAHQRGQSVHAGVSRSCAGSGGRRGTGSGVRAGCARPSSETRGADGGAVGGVAAAARQCHRFAPGGFGANANAQHRIRTDDDRALHRGRALAAAVAGGVRQARRQLRGGGVARRADDAAARGGESASRDACAARCPGVDGHARAQGARTAGQLVAQANAAAPGEAAAEETATGGRRSALRSESVRARAAADGGGVYPRTEVEVEDGDESASGESGDVKEEEAEERGSTTEMEVPRPQHQKSRSWTGKLSRAISRYRGGDAAESSGSGGGKHASALHTRSTSRGERAHRGTVSGAATTPPGGTRTSAAPTPRLVVFVAGGVTYSEMRAAIQAAAHHPQVEVVVGGSDWITPQDFIRALVALDDPAEAAALDRLPVDPELERALETTAAAATDAGERASAPVGNGQLSAATADGSATPSPTVSLWRRCLPCLAPPRTKESVS